MIYSTIKKSRATRIANQNQAVEDNNSDDSAATEVPGEQTEATTEPQTVVDAPETTTSEVA